MKLHILAILTLIQFNVSAQNDSAFVHIEPGKIFLSHDLGENWSRADHGFPTDAVVNALALADNVVVAATEEHGIYISEDGLKTWLSVTNGLSPKEKVNSLIYHQGYLFAGTFRNGIFISGDKGRTWKPASGGLTIEPVRSFYSMGNTLLAGADQGIYRLTHAGFE